MTKTTYVEFPSAGHSVVSNNPCAQQITAAFLNNPNSEPDLSCRQDRPGPKFVLPDEIIISPSMHEIHYGELGSSRLEENLFLGSWLTLIGSGLIAIISGLIKLFRKDQTPNTGIWARIALPLLIIFAVSALVWGYSLRSSLQQTANSASTILRFGLKDTYWWLFAMALLIGFMTLGMVVVTVYAWKRNFFSLPGKVAFTISTLIALTFSSVLGYWGLFNALFTQ